MLSIPFEKKFFIFLPLDNVSECVIMYALTPRKLSRFCLSRSSSHLRRRPFILFQNHLIIFHFLRLSIGIFIKIFFIFPSWQYAVSVYNRSIVFWTLFVTCFRWFRKRPFSLRTTFFLFQNLSIIQQNYYLSTPKILEKIFYFSTWQNQKTDYNITRIDSLIWAFSFAKKAVSFWRDLLFFIRQEARNPNF